jgi:hypothetical protein
MTLKNGREKIGRSGVVPEISHISDASKTEMNRRLLY